MFPAHIINDYGAATGSSQGSTITPNASNHVKGNYTQLSAATTYAGCELEIEPSPNTNNADYLIDIAVGAAASEQVIISNLLLGATVNNSVKSVRFPLAVPAGVRLSARCQCSTGGTTCFLQVKVFAPAKLMPGVIPPQLCTTYGDNTADSGGTGVDPGGVAHTLGSYSEITASTTYAIKFLVMAIGCQNNAAPATGRWLVNVAVGAGGAEQVIIPNIRLAGSGSTAQGAPTPQFVGFPANIPAGTRIAVNAQSSIIDATDRLLDVVMYGLS